MQELENLLNSLIQRGWKPWGEKSKKIIIRSSRIFVYNSEWYINPEGKHIRSIVSLESLLWQFVCDKELVKNKTSEKIIKRYIKETLERESWNITEADIICTDLDPEYRLLESALIPEEELGKFLVDNIIITWNSK